MRALSLTYATGLPIFAFADEIYAKELAFDKFFDGHNICVRIAQTRVLNNLDL